MPVEQVSDAAQCEGLSSYSKPSSNWIYILPAFEDRQIIKTVNISVVFGSVFLAYGVSHIRTENRVDFVV